MRKKMTSMGIDEYYITLCRHNSLHLSELLDYCQLQLFAEIQKENCKTTKMYIPAHLTLRKQINRTVNRKKCCIRIPREVWEYCELNNIKKSVFAELALLKHAHEFVEFKTIVE